MRSVVDEVRREDQAAVAGLSPAERVRLALELGARDVERFRLAHDPPLEAEAAARELERRRQAGRLPSRCMSELIG